MFTAQLREQAKIIIAKAKQSSFSLVTAESCTGGLLSALLTDIEGASEVFLYGIATYSNEAKHTLVHVSEETLQTFGAVSEQTALAMAKGVLPQLTQAMSISITGIAGPGGGSVEKPVGLVHMACVTSLRLHGNYRFHFTGSRQEIRMQAVMAAVHILSNALDTYIP